MTRFVRRTACRRRETVSESPAQHRSLMKSKGRTTRPIARQCGVGVSGLWWVSEILRGVSLEGLVAQVGRVLGDARSLYGSAPRGGGWSTTPALSASRDGIAAAGAVVGRWGGAAASRHLAAAGG